MGDLSCTFWTDGRERDQPFSFWWHPFVSLLDAMIQLLVLFTCPIYTLAQYSPTEPSKERTSKVEHIRKLVSFNFDATASPRINDWSRSSNCDIVEHVASIPNNPNILGDLGIVTTKQDKEVVERLMALKQSSQTEENDLPPVEIVVQFPVNLLKGNSNSHISQVKKKKNRNGTVALETLDLSQLFLDNHSVPVVVFMHGGGFTIGGKEDGTGIGFAHRPSVETNKPLIFVSLGYRLAPDHVFPAGICDCLVGFNYIASLLIQAQAQQQYGMSITNKKQGGFDKIPLHLLGQSAGASMALVTAMEFYRCKPGLIKSVVLQSPMINPAADSLSFYLNSQSAWHIPASWIRWSWQAYLELRTTGNDEQHKNMANADNLLTLEERVAMVSNRAAWNKCKWRGSMLERLVWPLPFLPTLDQNDAPKIMVTTSAGDPLCDDGFAVVQALRDGAKIPSSHIQHIHTNGTHFLGFTLDRHASSRLTAWWIDVLFPCTTRASSSG